MEKMNEETVLTFRGDEVWDHREYWWARFGSQIHWAMPNGPADSWTPVPWTYPEWDGNEFHEPDFHAHFQKLTDGVAWEYALWVQDEVLTEDGIAFHNDPRVGVGMVWTLFDPAKEVKP